MRVINDVITYIIFTNMGKPFGDLEKRALAILANNGNPASSQDKELANYWSWKINPADASHDLSSASTRTAGRKLLEATINPFGINMAANNYAKVTISDRSEAALGTPFKTVLDLRTLTEGQTAYALKGFVPARVYGRKGAGATPVNRVSRITKRKYKSYYEESDQGYSSPFGQKAESDTVKTRQQEIKLALLAESTGYSLVTFSPEKVRGA